MAEGPPAPEARKLAGDLAGWRDSLRSLRDATESAAGEIAALRREAGAATAELWSSEDEPPSPEAQKAVLTKLSATLERVEQGLRAGARQLKDREDQAVSSVLAMLRATADDVRRVRVEPSPPQAELMEAVTALQAGLARAMEEMRRDAVHIREAVSRPRTDREALRRLEAAIADIQPRFADIEARISEEAAQRQVASNEQAEVGKRLETAMVVLKDEVVLMATALRQEVAGPMAELAGERESLRQGLDRVQRLSEVVQSLGRRRGFRELVKTEQALQAEQAAFVERLSAAGEGLEALVQVMERRLDAMVEAAVERIRPDPAHTEALAGAQDSAAALRQELPAVVEELAARMEESTGGLQASVEALSGAVQGGDGKGPESAARAQRELRSATTALRKEVEAFSKRIEGWGKPRTAPRLAQELRDLGRRFEALEEEVKSELAAAVSNRVRASVDRRLKALLEELPDQIREIAREGLAEPAPETTAEPAPQEPRQPRRRFESEPERRGRFRRPRR